ncbi:MAG: hypothetical protein US49_C0001G0275 [candidate division TM6 bacterium GW2011_GWF2_37_49]|nr:MAG: hypothetical protein US49_C0001G0275 [candidate division TM6 bacterium GW2011_GWF2_37_49]
MVSSKTLSFLVLFSFIFLNLSILLYLQVDPLKYHSDVDSSAYLGKSELLYKSGTFAPTPAFENMPYFVLGYPMFMAIIYKITSDSIDFLIWAQILLVLLSAFLIFLTSRRLFNEAVGIIAFALTCINLGFLVFAQFVLTETLLSFLFIAFIERFSLYLTEKNTSALYWSGLILGLSVCVKPAALYYPLLLLPLLYILNKNNPQKTKFLTNFSIMFAIPIFFYMVHNKAAFNEFKISKLESQNIYFWFYPNVLAFVHGTTSNAERAKLQMIAGADYERIDVVKNMFWADLKAYPIGLFPYIWGKNVIKTFLGLYTSNLKVLVDPNVHGGDISFFNMQGTFLQKAWLYIQSGASYQWVKIVGLLEAIWSLLRYFLCLIALLWLFYKKRFDLLGLFLSFIFYFSIVTGHDGCARFRMMFEFILIILAALGLWLIIKRGKHNILDQEINYENQD